MTKKIVLTSIDFKLLSILRKQKQFIKSEIATELKIPWSTAYKSIKRLSDAELLVEEYEKNNYRANIAINSHNQFYAGVCVGSSNIKLVIIGLDFEIADLTLLSQNEREMLKRIFGAEDEADKCQWCMITPETRRKVSEILIEICNVIANMNYNIKAITFSFPGCIDFENQEIISTANLFPEEPIIHNADISLLITSSVKDKLEKKGMKIYIDHNVKTSTIAEKEMLCMKDEKIKDMIVLYLGKGIGIGMVLNNQLVRSDKNAAGQYGHILMNNPKENGELKELEDIIRDDVFNGLSMTSSGEKLREFIADAKHIENKELLINVIKLSLSNLIKILGVRNIVFSGKFDKILTEIERELAFSLAGVGENALHIRHSNYGEYSGAVGAAIGAYYNYYDIDYIWN